MDGGDLGTCEGVQLDMVWLTERGSMTLSVEHVGLTAWSAHDVFLVTNGNSNVAFALFGLTFDGDSTRTVGVKSFTHDLRYG